MVNKCHYIVKTDKNLYSSFTLCKTSHEWYDFVDGFWKVKPKSKVQVWPK